ncbi:Aste57867_19151 [Aphanomyces stellatus]|uniref:Aste57867_19151 protein n=1 Tax=Aphanomyces stellatus TaxID=120398 RepID=A0A485LCI6_9STRA|nr:hypothetical protein As57867_019087 [Aphanomyces stellatus]VFT95873.1 Aste57867_19151 [Aphanomyces stellatus]
MDMHLPREGSAWTRAQLDACVLLDSAVDEALRLAHSTLMVRETIEDTSLCLDGVTYNLRKGERVAMYPTLDHSDPAIFASPHDYQVDRFVHATKRQKDALHPFGMGKHMCPGRVFAKLQLKTWVSLLLRHTTSISLTPNSPTPSFDTARVGLGVFPPTANNVTFQYNL